MHDRDAKALNALSNSQGASEHGRAKKEGGRLVAVSTLNIKEWPRIRLRDNHIISN